MPSKLNSTEGLIEVSRTVVRDSVDSPKEFSQEKIKIRPFVTDPASVSVGLGATVKTGDFEFARVDVRVVLPAYREEIPEVFQQAYRFAADRVEDIVSEITGVEKGGKETNSENKSEEEKTKAEVPDTAGDVSIDDLLA